MIGAIAWSLGVPTWATERCCLQGPKKQDLAKGGPLPMAGTRAFLPGLPGGSCIPRGTPVLARQILMGWWLGQPGSRSGHGWREGLPGPMNMFCPLRSGGESCHFGALPCLKSRLPSQGRGKGPNWTLCIGPHSSSCWLCLEPFVYSSLLS